MSGVGGGGVGSFARWISSGCAVLLSVDEPAFAAVGAPRAFAWLDGATPGRTAHRVGMPPEAGGDVQDEMPDAALLVVEPVSGGYLLDRLAADGADAGDTWHETRELVDEQVMWEYDLDRPPEWTAIPAAVDDPREYALRRRPPAQRRDSPPHDERDL